MKNLNLCILLLLFAGLNGSLKAQPQYYNYNTSGSANAFPFNVATGKEVQLLYLPGDFNQPAPAPAGIITTISFRINDGYTLGPWTYTDLTIKMGQSSITSFTAGSFYPGALTTVYYRASVSLTGAAGQWMTITLDSPFYYDPSQSLIIDIGQCSAPGATGFSLSFTNLAGNRRIWSVGGCPFVYSSVNSSVYHLGFSIVPLYYNYNTTGSANSFPFNIAAGKEVQLLYLPGDFNQPVSAPAGNIQSISFRINDGYPLGPWIYTDLTIKMGQSSITSFTAGSFYPGTLTTVYYRASVSLNGPAGTWMTINLDTPFLYDPTQSLIVDVGQCSAPGATGFSTSFTYLSGNRRIWSVGGCPFVYSSLNNAVHHIGFSICPLQVPTITGANNLCVNTGDYIYTTEPGMNNYAWTVSAGGMILNGSGTNQITVSWITPGAQTVSVNYTNDCGSQAPAPTVLNVTVNDLPAAAGSITGSASVCAGTTGVGYSVVPVTGAMTYIWNLPAGASIASGELTNDITVNFAADAVSGPITVIGNNLCGNGPPSPPFNVTVIPIPPTPTITANGYLLTSSASAGNQWYFNGAVIPGATGQTHLATQTGIYTCIVTLNGCNSAVSNEIFIIMTGIEESGIDAALSIYPNPGDGLFTLQINAGQEQTFTIQIFNDLGVLISELNEIKVKGTVATPIDVRPAANGIYTFVIRGHGAQIIKKVLVNN